MGSLACPRAYELGIIAEIQGKSYRCIDRTAKFVDGRWDIFLGWNEKAHEQAKQNGLLTNQIIKIIK